MDRLRWAVVAVGAMALAGCSGATSSDAPSPTATPADGVLTVATLFPQTEAEADLTPPMAAGVQLAVKEINKAGGVNGERVRLVRADTAEAALRRGADVVIGTGDSDVTLSVLDSLVGAGVMVVSPSDTADSLTLRDNRGLFWRTAAPDSFQGTVLADTVVTAGTDEPAVLVLRGTYGEGLAAAFQRGVEAWDGSLAGEPVLYDADDPDLAPEVRQVRRSRPDGIVLIGTSESAAVISELVDQGIGPDRRPLYLVDGNLTQEVVDALPAGVLDGSVGTLPGAQPAPEFRKLLDRLDSDLSGSTYAPEAYDAVVVSALAATAATSDRGEAAAGQMVSVTNGGDPCEDFADCERLLQQGQDVDYHGVSGPIDFQADGNPGQAVMGVYRFEDGEWTPEQYVEGTVPPPVAPSPAATPASTPTPS